MAHGSILTVALLIVAFQHLIMSEQSKPEQSKPEQSNSSSSLNQLIEKVQPTLQKAWVGSRPTVAQLLKGTIGTLQKAVDGLEHQMQAEGSTTKPLDFTPVKNLADKFWQKAQPLWVKVVGLVRDRLPQDVNQKLSDRALSGVLAGIMLLVFWVTTHLPGGATTPKPAPRPITTQRPSSPTQPKNQSAIAKQFPVDVGQNPGTAFPKDLRAPGITPPVSPPVSPQASPQAAPQPVQTAPLTAPPSNPTINPIPNNPPAIAATPVQPKPVKLTPEQKLLAKIQESTNSYAPNLTQAVKPNKASSTIKVTLASNWYDLPPEQQDQLSANLLNQAQTLKFKSLELQDSDDNLLARSPIVGNEMVILLRQRS